MTRAEAQAILDEERAEVERIQALFDSNGRIPREHETEVTERVTRLKDKWEANRKGWLGTPLQLIMGQAAVELSSLRRNARPKPEWFSVLYQVHGTLLLHEA